MAKLPADALQALVRQTEQPEVSAGVTVPGRADTVMSPLPALPNLLTLPTLSALPAVPALLASPQRAGGRRAQSEASEGVSVVGRDGHMTLRLETHFNLTTPSPRLGVCHSAHNAAGIWHELHARDSDTVARMPDGSSSTCISSSCSHCGSSDRWPRRPPSRPAGPGLVRH